MPTPDSGRPVVGVPPPTAVLAIVNPVVRGLARTPAWRLLGSIGVLRFRGRRTGRAFAVPVGIHDLGNGSYGVFSLGTWRLNFRGGTAVEVLLKGRRRSGRAELVEDPDEVGPAFLVALGKVGSPRQLGLSVMPGHQVTADDLAAVGRSLIRIRFDD